MAHWATVSLGVIILPAVFQSEKKSVCSVILSLVVLNHNALEVAIDTINIVKQYLHLGTVHLGFSIGNS